MKSQTFGEKIKELRKAKQYSLKYIGTQLNCSVTTISQIENNKKTAPEHLIAPLSKILNIDYKDLMIKYLSEKIFYEVKTSDYAKEALKVVARRLEKEGEGTQEVKEKEEVIQSIKLYFDNKPVEKAWIFGSYARNTNISYDSDIDILVQFKKPNKLTLFDVIEMKSELAKKTGRAIDLVEKGQEFASIRSDIHKEKILVYAK